MLPKYYKTILNASRILLLLVTIFYIMPVFAQDANTDSGISTLSAQDMLVNIAHQVPSIMKMVTAIAYVFGMALIFQGLLKLKHAGESRTMMSHEHSLMGPIVLILVGTMLLYIPTAVQVGTSTFWATPNPYGYDVKLNDQWMQFINDCFLIIQLVGTIAFIRGLVMLSHLAERSGQGVFGKGLTHIIGGIFCINIYQVVQVIMITLGIQTS